MKRVSAERNAPHDPATQFVSLLSKKFTTSEYGSRVDAETSTEMIEVLPAGKLWGMIAASVFLARPTTDGDHQASNLSAYPRVMLFEDQGDGELSQAIFYPKDGVIRMWQSGVWNDVRPATPHPGHADILAQMGQLLRDSQRSYAETDLLVHDEPLRVEHADELLQWLDRSMPLPPESLG
jgi:hypothetical protein